MHSIESLLPGSLIAAIANGLVGISLVWDKVLFRKKGMGSLAAYVFWLGALSILALLLIPLGFHMPPWKIVAIALAAGLLDLGGVYFYYAALKAGEVSQELAAMGGFTPVATLLFAIPLLGAHLDGQLAGFVLMTLGSFAMFLAEKLPLGQMLPRILAAAVLLGLSNALEKVVFNAAGFISGFTFYNVGMFAGAMMLLLRPTWRKEILHPPDPPRARSRIGYFANRVVAGAGNFLVVFSVSRANPAVVEAIAGVRYVIIFLAAYAITKWHPKWFKEDFTTRTLVIKIAGTALVVSGLALVATRGPGISSR